MTFPRHLVPGLLFLALLTSSARSAEESKSPTPVTEEKPTPAPAPAEEPTTKTKPKAAEKVEKTPPAPPEATPKPTKVEKVSPKPTPPQDPYKITALTPPQAIQGQVATVDFTPEGNWMILGKSGVVYLKNRGKKDWKLWSGHGLEGATGLFAGYWPKSIYVVHATGITRLFDTDNDGQADFVKAAIPAWRFSTLGELFHDSPAVLENGDLLLSPNVTSGEWSGLIMRLPESAPVKPWLTGFAKVTAPTSGPEGTWILAGIPKSLEGSTQPSTAAIWVVPREGESSEIEEAPPTADPDTSPDNKEKATEEPTDNDDAVKSEEPAPPIPPKPVTLPIAAIQLPPALMPTAPIRPVYPSGAKPGRFGAFSG
ncbi:MAG: hypothetical protein KDN20_26620, partial [Verrucomicrobiae bacterium]|nr:hypothetical protein [Verrucomicrobiae bacterium]